MVSITSLEVQREIIACIPEVLDDSEHTGVARELRYKEHYSLSHSQKCQRLKSFKQPQEMDYRKNGVSLNSHMTIGFCLQCIEFD